MESTDPPRHIPDIRKTEPMSAILEEPPQSARPERSEPHESSESAALPGAAVLDDKTPEWFRMPAITALFVVVIGSVFLLMANRPLWHTDLWDHINYGQYVIDHLTVMRTEPLLPLAQGMPMIDIPWLPQIGLALLNSEAGPSSLQFAHGLLIAASLGIIAWISTVRTGSCFGGLAAAAVFLALNFQQFLVIRPQLLGVLFFSMTAAWCLGRRKMTGGAWIGMPLLFALWANCHGSFSVGLTMLGLTACGRFGDVLLGSRRLRTAIRDPGFIQQLLMTQLCAAAVLLNPAGLEIYPAVFSVAENPNVQTMFEWNPLTLRMKQGQWAAAISLLALAAVRLTPRRLRSTEILSVIVFGILALWSARMINWWAPLMAIFTATHLTAAARHLLKIPRIDVAPRRSGLWTVVNLGLCWILFSLTNLGVQIVHGRVPEPARALSRQTPVRMTEFLREQTVLPEGIVFVPAEWAGYVMHAGPPSLKSMVNLHVHVIPEEVWADYLRLLQGTDDWEYLLERYGINLVIVDVELQAGLEKRLSESSQWTRLYRDHQAGVFSRNKPIQAEPGEAE